MVTAGLLEEVTSFYHLQYLPLLAAARIQADSSSSSSSSSSDCRRLLEHGIFQAIGFKEFLGGYWF